MQLVSWLSYFTSLKMERHTEHMNDFIHKLADSKSSPVITQEKYDSVVNYLKNPDIKVHPKFKFWVKAKQFQLMSLPALGLQDSLVVPKSDKVIVLFYFCW